ncbi:MAG: hypothetical protein WD670_05205, partial [Actinomycetota bacterium]
MSSTLLGWPVEPEPVLGDVAREEVGASAVGSPEVQEAQTIAPAKRTRKVRRMSRAGYREPRCPTPRVAG